MVRHGDSDPSDDICPVCKSSRYLNPSLQFLINPECYHKMCSTCVDRIFTSGPGTCPVPYCGRTLRKKGFHKAFFEDLTVEREVDIRKRVGAVYNRRQDEFETLRDWNNYLEEVESLVFDLVEGTPKERLRAEESLKIYKEGNKGEIEENRRAGEEEEELARTMQKVEKDAARQRRIHAQHAAEAEKADVAKTKLDVLDRLASTNGNANQIAQQAQKVILKKSTARRNLSDRAADAGTSDLDSGLSIRGLKKRLAPVVEKPYDPFGGLDLTPSSYVLRDDYDFKALSMAKTDPRHHAGGYSLHEYCGRLLFEAFSGLGVFIEDEVEARTLASAAPASLPVATAAAVEAAAGHVDTHIKMEIDDVF